MRKYINSQLSGEISVFKMFLQATGNPGQF